VTTIRQHQAVTVRVATNSFGSMDLDTRPPPLQRSTIGTWLQECASCGFVSPELGRSVPSDIRTVASDRYRLELPGRARLANRFVCRSLLDEATGDLVSAGWRRLHAAWACDDARLPNDQACVQRRASIELFERARAKGEHAMKSVVGGDLMLCADLARRAGDLDQVLAYCEVGLALPAPPAFLRKLLAFEQALVRARDTACHSVAEADRPAGGEKSNRAPSLRS